jgi:hypothetical protein
MVVKQILPKYSRNAEFIKMFIDEAKIAVTLTHGNIVPVYELGRIDGIYFIAMEYIPGKDLADILETARKKSTPLTAEHAVYIAIEICKGLDYAHRRTDESGKPRRVVHRDISPPNVLLSMEGEVKITDFGIAKATHKLGNTEAGVVKGTFGYMSPEQVRGLPVDHRTDIFSAGILLHEMLTGRRLFTGDSELEAIERVKVAKVPAPSSINPKLPSAIDPIVFRALAKDHSDRFADANEFQLALSRFLFTSGKGASASTLSRYMHQLFDDDLIDQLPDFVEPGEVEPTDARPKSAIVEPAAQLFAARPEFEEATVASRPPQGGRSATEVPARPGGRAKMDMGAGASLQINATLALPSLAEEARQVVPADGPFPEDERTEIFKNARPPQRPEVPVLRFPPKEKQDRAAPRLFADEAAPSDGDLPSPEELATLADSLEDGEAAPAARSRSKIPTPKPAASAPAAVPSQPKKAAAAASEMPDLIGLMSRPPTSEMPALGAAAPSSELAPVAEVVVSGAQSSSVAALDGEDPSQRRKKRAPSGIVSSTMRLFVEGLDDEEAYPLHGGNGQGELNDSSQLPASDTGAVDQVPRTLKPTVLGWLIILAVVLGAGGFVLYKKTNLFASRSSNDRDDTLRPEDIRKEVKKEQKRGTLVLVVKPPEANVFRFVGETPTFVERLDQGQVHLLRVERDGYQTIYKTISSADLASEQNEVKVSLSPIGPGAKDDLPLPEQVGAATGKLGRVRVRSDPPTAMVWLHIGRGEKLEIKDLDTSKSVDFKVVLSGYQPEPVHVSSVDFANKDSYTTTVTLQREGASSQPASQAASQPAAKPEPKTKPEPEPKTKPEPEPKTKPAAMKKPIIRIRPKGKKSPKKTKKPVPAKAEKKTPSKAKLPDWAK